MDRTHTVQIRAAVGAGAGAAGLMARRRPQGRRLLAAAAATAAAGVLLLFGSGGSIIDSSSSVLEDPACFVAGLREGVGRDERLRLVERGYQPRRQKWERPKWDACSKREYIRRLQHRRWAAQSEYPRIFGYVDKWDDEKGEGIITDQEKTQKYLVIRDEIGMCYHNYKTLQKAEMVEFFATDEMDEVAGLPLAKNVSGPLGTYVKTSEEYRHIMLRSGAFPKRWADNVEDFKFKTGEWWVEDFYWFRGKKSN
mmetsp:Transcript_120473/g.302810  ORF Transcript_120473/g.302810 Transcript_120473/m.302810 type:complete len:253 (-) Transcript_120473:52-810(-)